MNQDPDIVRRANRELLRTYARKSFYGFYRLAFRRWRLKRASPPRPIFGCSRRRSKKLPQAKPAVS